MIPQMQSHLKKTQSLDSNSSNNNSRPSSGHELKFIPPAHFNYGPPVKPSTNNIDKK